MLYLFAFLSDGKERERRGRIQERHLKVLLPYTFLAKHFSFLLFSFPLFLCSQWVLTFLNLKLVNHIWCHLVQDPELEFEHDSETIVESWPRLPFPMMILCLRYLFLICIQNLLNLSPLPCRLSPSFDRTTPRGDNYRKEILSWCPSLTCWTIGYLFQSIQCIIPLPLKLTDL